MDIIDINKNIYYKIKNNKLIIYNNIALIGEGAFRGCLNFEEVIIYNGITSIGNAAFSGCKNLK